MRAFPEIVSSSSVGVVVVLMVVVWWCAVSPKLSACFQQTSSSPAPASVARAEHLTTDKHEAAWWPRPAPPATSRHQESRGPAPDTAAAAGAGRAVRPGSVGSAARYRGAGYWRGGGGQASIICTQSARSQPSTPSWSPGPMPGRDT